MSEPEPVAEQPSPVQRKPRSRAGLIGALSGFGAAVLTMIGTFQDLLTAQIFLGPDRQTFVITSWSAAVETNGAPGAESDGAPLNVCRCCVRPRACSPAPCSGCLPRTGPPAGD